jgi:glycine/D-amino acid oxidase-like deaminating enzyme
MPFSHDLIIIGQGLAGTVLSEVLIARGLRVMMFDAPLPGRATQVATGLVNPISLRRTVATWRASEMLAIAGAFYRDLEQRYQRRFWNPINMVELFPTAKEAGIWQLRMKDPELSRLLSTAPLSDPGLDELPQPYSYGSVQRCAWLDTNALLTAHRARWLRDGNLEERRVTKGDILPCEGGSRVFSAAAPLVVHCPGPFGAHAGLVPVRGEGLTVRIEGLRLKSAVHRGVFIVPIGDERFRVGSTFAWDDVWSGPTDEARRLLLDGLARLTPRPVTVEEHWAGVRPASKDRRPIIGRTGAHEAILNGFGSRGVLLAPWSAQHLAAHLFDGAPLDPEADAARFA